MTQLKRISIQFEQLNILRIFFTILDPIPLILNSHAKTPYGEFDSETNITIRFAMISDGLYGISLARK